MNTLQPDASVTLVIPAGETLSLNGTGTVTNLGTNVVTEVSGVSIYGPFAGAATVIVAAGSRRDVIVFPGVPVEVQDGSEPLAYQLSSEGGGGGGAALTPQQVAAGAVGVLASNNAGLAIEPDGDPLAAGGGGGATNLAVTASPTGVTVTSDTGTDAAIPLANGTNAGLMAPAQHTKLGDLPTAGDLAAALNGKANSSHTHSIGNVTGLATALDGKAAKAASGTVGASAVTLGLSDALLAGVPLTITVTPESTCTVLVESSSDGGSTYTTVGSAVGVSERWEYDRAPGEAGWITNLRFTRTAGTATTSTYSIRS